MTEKTFFLSDGYIHIPIKSRDESGITVDIIADGEKYAQYYIPIAKSGEECDFYAYLDLSAYNEVKFICTDSDDEIVLSYYCDMKKNNIKILSDGEINCKVYELDTIWKG